MKVPAIIDRFRSSFFLRNALVLTSGTFVSQFIAILTVPLVSRIYAPESYGTLGYYITITTLMATVATLQYQNAIILAKDEDEAGSALSLCFTTSFFVALGCLVLFLFAGGFIINLMQAEHFEGWLLLTPISIFASGVNAGLMAYANRQQKFKLMTTNRIIAALLIPSISISIGLMSPGSLGLIVSVLASHVLPTLLLSYHFFYRNKLRLHWDKSKMIGVFKAHSHFPKYSLPAEFINSFINNIPVLLLGRLHGPASVGLYNMSNRLLGLPVQLISGSVTEVFRQRATAEYHKEGHCDRFFKKTFISMAALSVVPFILIILFGPQLFKIFLGDRWTEAGFFSGILAPVFFLRFSVAPLTYMYYIAGKQREDLIVHIVMVLLLAVAMYAGNSIWPGASGSLYGFTIVYSLFYIFYLIRSYQFSKGLAG